MPEPMGSVKERRRSPRETVLVDAISARAHLPNGEVIQGMVKDLSPEGARIQGDPRGLAVGDQIELLFIFPLNHKIEYRCTVRHIAPGESYGVEFMN